MYTSYYVKNNSWLEFINWVCVEDLLQDMFNYLNTHFVILNYHN